MTTNYYGRVGQQDNLSLKNRWFLVMILLVKTTRLWYPASLWGFQWPSKPTKQNNEWKVGQWGSVLAVGLITTLGKPNKSQIKFSKISIFVNFNITNWANSCSKFNDDNKNTTMTKGVAIVSLFLTLNKHFHSKYKYGLLKVATSVLQRNSSMNTSTTNLISDLNIFF